MYCKFLFMCTMFSDWRLRKVKNYENIIINEVRLDKKQLHKMKNSLISAYDEPTKNEKQ